MADVAENQNLSRMSMPELLVEQKKRKTLLFIHQFTIGLVVGAAVYLGVTIYIVGGNGFLIFQLIIQLFLIFVFVRSAKAKKVSLQNVRAEIKARNNSEQFETRATPDFN